MVFGVFDGLHEGHHHFLSEAIQKCDELIVVVAPDEVARILKGHSPHVSLQERIEAITAFAPHVKVVSGDSDSGSWKVLDSYTPDMVILGYDQGAIADELETRAIPYMYLSAHEPGRFKSSILNGVVKPWTSPES